MSGAPPAGGAHPREISHDWSPRAPRPEIYEPLDVAAPEPEDLRFWSVTTILGALGKEALIQWAANEAAASAIDDIEVWRPMLAKAGREEAAKWIAGARWRRPEGERSAAELGEAVHKACEEYALSGRRPEVDAEVAPFLDRFDEWLDVFQPEYLGAEVTVYSPQYGYAGTCDGFLRIDGIPLIIDYKTSKRSFDRQGKPTAPYPEAALQLAAYRWAELAAIFRPRRYEAFRRRYYLLSEKERAAAIPLPQVEGGLIIHITPEHCVAYPARCSYDVFERFLYVQEVARWQFEEARGAIGAPLERS